MTNSRRHTAFSIAWVALAIGLIPVSAVRMEVLQDSRRHLPQESLFDHVRLDLPLSAISFGFGSTIASTWYVLGLLELADDILVHGGGSRLPRLIRTTTILDPDWQDPYNLALIIEDSLGRPRQETIELLSDAVARHPESWRFRSYLAMSILRYPELGLQDRIDSSAKVMQSLESSKDSTIPEHLRYLGRSIRTGEKNALVNLMLGSYFAKSLVSGGKFRGELAGMLERRTGLPPDFIHDFLDGVNALPLERRGEFATLEFLTSAQGSSFVDQFRSLRSSTTALTAPESESSKSP